MKRRPAILFGMAGGAAWAVALMVLTRGWRPLDGWPPEYQFAVAIAPGGVVLLLMIARIAQRRFFDDAIIDGQPPAKGSAAEIDDRVLRNTVEQLVLALCLWPLIGLILGHGAVLALGLSFGATRILFWIGYHLSPPLRAFGFAAGFYPTILFLLLAGLVFPGGV